MKKKLFNIFISVFLISFSFYYTNKIVKEFRNNDPIMKEIEKYSKKYGDTKIDSIKNDNEIILGLNGEKVDINSSYLNMKKVGKFDKNLLVFKESISDDINYNNYIVSLNEKSNNVSLIFKIVNTDNVNKIIHILNQKKVNATFFINKEVIDKSIDIVKLIIDNGNDVELLSNSYSVYEINKYNSIFKQLLYDKLNFCINSNKDKSLLKACETSKLYTIAPSLEIDNNLYYSIKNNLKNGLIISLSNNKKIVKELSSTINYIEQKGKKIVLLKTMIP